MNQEVEMNNLLHCQNISYRINRISLASDHFHDDEFEMSFDFTLID